MDEFHKWLNEGITKGWCSHVVCATHAGIPLTPDEEALAESDELWDMCQFVIRVWE